MRSTIWGVILAVGLGIGAGIVIGGADDDPNDTALETRADRTTSSRPTSSSSSSSTTFVTIVPLDTEVVARAIKDLGIELDRDLVRTLNRNYKDLKIVSGNACDAYSIHKKSGLGKIGYIICCLPFVSLPNEVGERILGQIDRFMQKGCVFRTFHYAHGYYMPSAVKLRKFMRSRYGRGRKSQIIVKNVPPAYTLTWQT